MLKGRRYNNLVNATYTAIGPVSRNIAIVCEAISKAARLRRKHANQTIFQVVNAPFIPSRSIDALESQ